MRQRSKWVRFCRASKCQTENKKTHLESRVGEGDELLGVIGTRLTGVPGNFPEGIVSPNSILPHRRGSGLAEQFSRSEIPSSFLPLSPFHLKSCLYSTDFSRFSILETKGLLRIRKQNICWLSCASRNLCSTTI